ncbi:MAG: Kazal-type serine protease inhibitor family protein [Polyangiales bacterium]
MLCCLGLVPMLAGNRGCEPEPPPDACPEIWAPVCGVDQHTYSSLCHLEAAGVALAYEGECESDGGLCLSNDDCAMGQACDHSECLSSCPDGDFACPAVCYGRCTDDRPYGCTSDADCARGEICDLGWRTRSLRDGIHASAAGRLLRAGRAAALGLLQRLRPRAIRGHLVAIDPEPLPCDEPPYEGEGMDGDPATRQPSMIPPACGAAGTRRCVVRTSHLRQRVRGELRRRARPSQGPCEGPSAPLPACVAAARSRPPPSCAAIDCGPGYEVPRRLRAGVCCETERGRCMDNASPCAKLCAPIVDPTCICPEIWAPVYGASVRGRTPARPSAAAT